MLNRTTNSIRKSIDALECRDVPTTLTQLNTIVGIVGQIRPTQPPPIPVKLQAPTVVVKAPDRPAADAAPVTGTHSVVSIRNESSAAIRFTLQWEGAATARSYVVQAGQTVKLWSTPKDMRFGQQPRRATIQFDASNARGFQAQTYKLTSRLETSEVRGGPPAGPGEQFAFQQTVDLKGRATGIDLQRVTGDAGDISLAVGPAIRL